MYAHTLPRSSPREDLDRNLARIPLLRDPDPTVETNVLVNTAFAGRWVALSRHAVERYKTIAGTLCPDEALLAMLCTRCDEYAAAEIWWWGTACMDHKSKDLGKRGMRWDEFWQGLGKRIEEFLIREGKSQNEEMREPYHD